MARMHNQDVFIVGAGNSAGQAAIHLAKHARSVTLLVRGDSLAKSMSRYLIRAIESAPNIAIRMRTEVINGGGSERLEYLQLADHANGTVEELPTAALFIMIGGEPQTQWLPDEIARDGQGYLITGRGVLERPRVHWDAGRDPFLRGLRRGFGKTLGNGRARPVRGPTVPADQGGRGIGARGAPGPEQLRQPRPTSRHWPATHAVASDIFLGWLYVASDQDGQERHYYGRQLKDWKGSAEIDQMTASGMTIYGELCGWTLARAHARSGDRIAIASYLGSSDKFDRALLEFSSAYADQNEFDYQAFVEAARSGSITAETAV